MKKLIGAAMVVVLSAFASPVLAQDGPRMSSMSTMGGSMAMSFGSSQGGERAALTSLGTGNGADRGGFFGGEITSLGTGNGTERGGFFDKEVTSLGTGAERSSFFGTDDGHMTSMEGNGATSFGGGDSGASEMVQRGGVGNAGGAMEMVQKGGLNSAGASEMVQKGGLNSAGASEMVQWGGFNGMEL
jgi:hypothetical protein